MRIVVIGASGTIGKHVADALAVSHTVIRASRTSGDLQVDITDPESIKAFYAQLGDVDAVVNVSGSGPFKPLADLTDEDIAKGLASKLMGQVNLVRYGIDHVRSSFTLTSGILSKEPVRNGSALSLINGGVEGFAVGAAYELRDRGVRVNVVSPPWIAETLARRGGDPANGQPAAEAAKAYCLAVEDSSLNGQTIDSRQVN